MKEDKKKNTKNVSLSLLNRSQLSSRVPFHKLRSSREKRTILPPPSRCTEKIDGEEDGS